VAAVQEAEGVLHRKGQQLEAAMYRPFAGLESTQGLKYCKRCGVGLGASTPPTETKSSFGKMMGMLLPVAAVSLGGFIALFTTVYSLGERSGFDSRALIGIMAFGGATVVCVIALLVWLLLRLAGYEPVTGQDRSAKPQFRDHVPQQLPASPVSMPSVTENTTRNFGTSAVSGKDVRD
jgi:hypothetical protein